VGVLREPAKVKLIFGLISNDKKIFLETEKILSKKFGFLDYSSKILPFNYTTYYNQELGKDLRRKFISCRELIKPNLFARIKIFTNKIEKKLSFAGKRRINIDPGYLSAGKLVLVSTKDYTHRIYLEKGIFAEVTLFYKNRSFHPWQWTYQDYKTKDYIEIFNYLYKIYLKQLRNEK
jgi:hypothetical protein